MTDIEDRLERVEQKLAAVRIENGHLRRGLRNVTIGGFTCIVCLAMVPGGVLVAGWLAIAGLVLGIARLARAVPLGRAAGRAS
jgi:hypothetical protein